MRVYILLAYLTAGLVSTAVHATPVARAATGSGKSYTGWDCCKPACAWAKNLNKGITGQPQVCDINNHALPTSRALAASSGCDTGGAGTAFLCDTYAPLPVPDDSDNNNALGFAVGFAATDCCRCFELTWTSGAARGRRMTVQTINVGVVGEGDANVTAADFVILTPGGGVGPNEAGCRNQYGTSWGRQYGGVAGAAQCGDLPQNLQDGCNWRWNWAGGDVNGWGITYRQVRCPQALVDVSGCSA